MSAPYLAPAAGVSRLHGKWRLSLHGSLYLQGSIVLTFLAASTAPSPLYGLYRQMWGFSPLTLTIVFASYALALLAALLVLGRVSDYTGRKPLTVGALLLELVSMGAFWYADSVAWLLAARVLQGVATGVVTSAVSASLLDLHIAKGSLLNSVAPMFGMAVGALGAATLVQFGESPTSTVYLALAALFLLQLIMSLFLLETVAARPGVLRSLRPHVYVPATTRATMWRLMPVSMAQWALGGLVLSLGPTLVRDISGSTAPLLGGALIAAVVLSAAIVIFCVRLLEPTGLVRVGAGLLTLGVVAMLVGVAARQTHLLFLGAVIAGSGFGSAFNGSVRSLVAITAPQDRAGVMSAFFVLSYLAFSLPAIAAGYMAGVVGLTTTAVGYCAILAGLSITFLLRFHRAGHT